MAGNLSKLAEYVQARLRAELADVFTYHDWRHTVDVRTAVLEFGRAAGLEACTLACLEAAALLHDIGYTAGCAWGHEERGAQLALRLLPEQGWTRQEADTVAKLIRATRFPCRPASLAEGIICDADIEYLGRREAGDISARLREELARTGRGFTESEWLRFELKFIENVRFFTAPARREREAGVKHFCGDLEAKLNEADRSEER